MPRPQLRPAAVASLVAAVLAAASCAGPGGPSGPGAGSIAPPSVSAPSPSEEPVYPLTVVDDDGVEVTIEEEPRRIVTFAPSITEIVFALGAGDRLVGVSGPYDDYPPEAASIEHVGGAGEFGVDPNLERVVALDPDLFLTIRGGEDWKRRLRELGIPVFTANAEDLDDLLADIRTIGSLLGEEEARAAADLAAHLAEQAAAVEAAVGEEPRVTCFFEVYYGPPIVTVGPGTYLFDLLERSGCDPVTAGARSDYPSWSVERLVAEGPEVYLVSSESGVSVDRVSERPGYDAVAAVAAGRVVLVDADLVSRAGPRVVEGLRALAEALHPDAVP